MGSSKKVYWVRWWQILRLISQNNKVLIAHRYLAEWHSYAVCTP